MSAELSRTSLAVVLGSAGLPGTIQRTRLAVVLGSAGLPGTIQRTRLAVVLTDPELLPPEPEPSASTTAQHPPLRPFSAFSPFEVM